MTQHYVLENFHVPFKSLPPRSRALIMTSPYESLKTNKRKQSTKIFSSYSACHQANFKEECQSALSFLGLYDLLPTKVEYFNFEQQRYVTISLIDDNEYVR